MMRLGVMMIMVAALFLLAAPTASAETIAEYVDDFDELAQDDIAPGQSLKTKNPSGTVGWDNLEFNWFDGNGDALAAAGTTVYLLDEEYLGQPDALSSTTTGYIAASTSISAGIYIFDTTVSVDVDTEYWIYTDDVVAGVAGIGGSSGYADGELYFAFAADSNYMDSSQSAADAAFRLTGKDIPTPEPGTIALVGLAASGLILRRRRRRSV